MVVVVRVRVRMCLCVCRNDTTVIPLEYAVVQRGHGSAGVGQFTFIVYHADDSSGSYHFSQFLSCSTEEDRDEWMHALGSCSTRELLADREESAASVMHAAEEMESVHVQLAAEQEQKKRIVEMLEAQAELGRALTVRHKLMMVVTDVHRQLDRNGDGDEESLGIPSFVMQRLTRVYVYAVIVFQFVGVVCVMFPCTRPRRIAVFPPLRVTGGAWNAHTASHEHRRKCQSSSCRLNDASEYSD